MKDNAGLKELLKENEEKLQENFKFMVLLDNDIDMTKYFKSEKDAALIESISISTRCYPVMGYRTFEITSKKNLAVYNINYAYRNDGDVIAVSLQTLKNGKQWDMPYLNANAIKYNK